MKKVYLFDIDENSGKGVFQISQVEEPAIEVNFIAFSKEVDVMEFSIDDEKMRLAGPILIANKEMYRKELDGYIKFTNESLEKARSSYKKNNNNFALNVEHSDKQAPSFVLEDWIVEKGIEDKSKKWNFSFDENVWFGVIQVTDKDYWEKFIKTGIVKGFSIEIDKSSVKIKENFNMEKVTKDIKLAKAELADKTIIYWDGEVIEVGTKIFLDEALTNAAPDGEHIDAKGNVVVTKDGVVVEIRPKVEEEMSNVDEKPATEILSKEEFNKLVSELSSRIDALETKYNEKVKENEELSKENDNLKKITPGAPSFVFKSDNKTVKPEKMTFSQELKERLKKQGKF